MTSNQNLISKLTYTKHSSTETLELLDARQRNYSDRLSIPNSSDSFRCDALATDILELPADSKDLSRSITQKEWPKLKNKNYAELPLPLNLSSCKTNSTDNVPDTNISIRPLAGNGFFSILKSCTSLSVSIANTIMAPSRSLSTAIETYSRSEIARKKINDFPPPAILRCLIHSDQEIILKYFKDNPLSDAMTLYSTATSSYPVIVMILNQAAQSRRIATPYIKLIGDICHLFFPNSKDLSCLRNDISVALFNLNMLCTKMQSSNKTYLLDLVPFVRLTTEIVQGLHEISLNDESAPYLLS